MLEARRAALGIIARSAADDLDQSAASTGRPSPVDHGQAQLEALRVERGINYRRPGGVEPRVWAAWAAEKLAAGDLDGSAVAGDVCAQTLDQVAAATVEPLPPITSPNGAAESGTYGSGTVGRVEGEQGTPAGLDGYKCKVHPSLATAFLSSKRSPVARLWVLLQAHDQYGQGTGRGFFDLDPVYKIFSGDGSPWHIGSRRRVQQLIKQGAGIFWTLRNPQPGQGGRFGGFTAIEMIGPERVARALGVGHLAGSPVGVPVADLLEGMHKANAALFSAALTLRTDDKGGRPTSRQTLKGMTGAAASTQRTYIRTAGVEVQSNYVTLPTGDVDGPGVFIYRGRIDGRPGRAILARRLPNSHDPQLTARPRGRVKKINRKLNLVTKGARGETLKIERIYHDTAAAAWGAWSKAYNDDHYWPASRTATGAALWGMVEAVNH